MERKSENNFWESVFFSFHHVVPGDEIQVIGLGANRLYLLETIFVSPIMGGFHMMFSRQF